MYGLMERSQVPQKWFNFFKYPVIGQGAMGTTYKIPSKDANEYMRKIKNVIKRGSHKDVYTVFYKTSTKPYVLLKIQQFTKPVDTVYNELNILKTLQGLSFIPKLYAATTTESSPMYPKHLIFMEYIDGIPLRQIHRDHYDLQKITRQLRQALMQMWKRGVIHTDLHTDNVLVTKDSDIYIIDFGLAHETAFIKKTAASLRSSNNVVQFWKEKLEAYANTLVWKKGHRTYNPNAKLITMIDTVY